MSNKRMPTEPSYFVPSILRPVKLFFGVGVGEGPGSLLSDDYLKSYSSEVFEGVSQRYHDRLKSHVLIILTDFVDMCIICRR